jgi:trimethylamine--corrinoid protein Co-methyltransferase
MNRAVELWSEEALAAIHATALELLARAGVKVPSPEVRELLAGAGCPAGDGERMLMPAGVVDDSLAACPREYRLLARGEGKDLRIDAEPGPVYVHNMGETAILLDPSTAVSRPALFADQVAAGRVMHHLSAQSSVNPLLSPQDVPGELQPLYSYLALAAETDKYLGGPGISFGAQVGYLREMAAAVIGDPDFGIMLDLAFSPVSPLQLGGEVSEGLVAAARAGLACEILPCPTTGTTGPAPLAAALAQQHAEVLAGIVVAQAVNPGTPVYYGARLQAGDPRTGAAVWGTPVLGLCAAGATLLARRCGLACDCYGLGTDAKVLDAQNGYERAVNGLLGALARPRYLSGVGSLHSVVAAGLEQLEIDDEILGYVLFAIEERPWDAEALDVDALVEGALAGSFLGVRQTRRYLRREACPTNISYHGGLQDWLTTGRTNVLEAARERLQTHLSAEPVGLAGDVEETLCAIIDKAAEALGLGEWPDPRRLLDEARSALAG